jgi:hypothetical protein
MFEKQEKWEEGVDALEIEEKDTLFQDQLRQSLLVLVTDRNLIPAYIHLVALISLPSLS